MSILESNYFKVDIQYLQKQQLLVVAKTPQEAKDMVGKNIAEGTELFAITAVAELTDEEKVWVLKNMQGLGDAEEAEIAEPSGEVLGTRTLN